MNTPESFLISGTMPKFNNEGAYDPLSPGGRELAGETLSEQNFQNALDGASARVVATPNGVETARQIHGAPMVASHSIGTTAVDGATSGDKILGGLASLRRFFDERISAVGEAGRFKSITNPSDLIATQMAAAELSLAMDVSSKIGGKLVQAQDTLVKGG